jgi:hypothetical protein
MGQVHLLCGKLRKHPGYFFKFYGMSVKSPNVLISPVKHVKKTDKTTLRIIGTVDSRGICQMALKTRTVSVSNALTTLM